MQTISIGREGNNQMVLNDNFVSRQHAQLILLDNGQVLIKDLGSSNGTFVNGNKVTESNLKAGDILKCANTLVDWQGLFNVAIQGNIQPQVVQQAVNPQQQSNSPKHSQIPNQQNVIVIGKQKSVGVAFALAFFFGPLGLLYASITGGVIMFLLSILIGIFTFGIGLIFTWIGCIIWAVIAAGNANKNMISDASSLIQNQYRQ